LLIEKMAKMDKQMDEAAFMHTLSEPTPEVWEGISFVMSTVWPRRMPS
jgi:hypothetical protein